MKRQILFSILLGLLWGCAQNPHTGFSIRGQLTAANGHKAYLNQTLGNALVPIDSANLGTEGLFEFKGTNSGAEFYILSVVSPDQKVTQNLQLIVRANEHVLLQGDLSQELKTNYRVSGSDESELVRQLNDRLRVAAHRLDSAAAAYRTALAANTLDSVQKAQIDQISRHTIDQHRFYSEQLIEQNDSSLIGVMALFQHLGRYETVFNLGTDFDLYQRVLQRLGPLYPESELVKSLRMMVLAESRRRSQQLTEQQTLAVGAQAPEIVLNDPQGRPVALSSLRGKYVLLDFWAAWCGPCRRENPTLVRNFQKYRAKGFVIYQVSLDKDKAHWTEAIQKDKLTWYHVSDLRHWQSEAARLYNVRSIPSNFLIDPQGKIVATQLRGEALGAKLREIYLF